MADERKTRAASIIDKYDGMFAGTFGIDERGLGGEISRIILREPGVVFYVFSVLMERRYDSATIIRVARILVDSTSRAAFNQVAADWDGYQMVKLVEKILKCDVPSNRGAIRCDNLYIAEITGLTAMRHAARGDKKQAKSGDNSAQPRKLSGVEMEFYAKYNKGDLIFYERDRRGTLRSYGGKRNNFDSSICWELPKSGTGFVVYNRDDLRRLAELKDKEGLDQIGTKETIEAMLRIAMEWNKLHPDRLLQYGDISRPGGVNTPDHATHDNGKAFDVRPLRKDSQTGDSARLEYTDTVYDRGLTKEFVLLIRRLYPGTKFLFNDKELNEVDSETRDFVNPSTKAHNNHLHVIFPGGN